MTADSSQAYSENLVRFSRVLREKGLVAGINETEDAVRVVEIVGFRNKTRLRTALGAVYAKSRREQKLFFEVFDDFFISENERKRRSRVKKEEHMEKEEQAREANDELQHEGKPLELSPQAKDMYANLPPEKRDQIMRYLDFSMDNPRHSPFDARFMQRVIEQRMMLYSSQGDGIPEVKPEEADLLHKNLSDITEEEIPHVIALIQSVVKRLNGAISREYRRSGKSGRLDFRRTIHKSLRTGGSFRDLSFKRRRRTKKRIVMLCDVSGSMVMFSQFAIRFVKSMSDVASRSETYLFSEDIMKVSPFVLADMSRFENYVKESGLWAKGTDIAKALDELVKQRPSPLSESTVLLILSDTRTVNVKAAVEKLKEVKGKVKRVIWMNPLPHERWEAMKSAAAFENHVQMLDCSTLDDLAKACAKSLI